MATASIIDNGPIKLEGASVLNQEGDVIRDDSKTTFLCRCGLSGQKPYCDGSHTGTFDSVIKSLTKQ